MHDCIVVVVLEVHCIQCFMCLNIYDVYIIAIVRGAEAGGILGVNAPHFFGLTTPTFWRDLKMGAGERRSKS